jgi:hypothetical protein
MKSKILNALIIWLIASATVYSAILDKESVQLLNAVDPTGTIAYSSSENVIWWTIKEVYIYVDTLNSTDITITIEAQPTSGAGWVAVWSKTYTATESDVVPVVEHPYALRISYVASGDVTGDSVTVYLIKKVEK